MGGENHQLDSHQPYKIPDYRIYKVSDVAELQEVQDLLAKRGLKDPWLRNEVWRYHPDIWKPLGQRIRITFFRGFPYGLIVALAAIAVEKTFFPSDDHHGHGDTSGHH